jgi:hypothetical protein
MLSETFWAGFYVFGGGFLITIAGLCYRSKCEDVNLCCGLIKFRRNIAVEMKEDLKFGLPNTSGQQQHQGPFSSGSNTPPARLTRESSLEQGNL